MPEGIKKLPAMKTKLTDAIVNNLTFQGKGDRCRVWDSVVQGLGVLITPSGRKSFFVDYFTAEGLQRRMKLGTVGVMQLAKARAEAKRILGEVMAGADPLGDRNELRKSMTLADFWTRYLESSSPHWKPNTAKEFTRLWEKKISPAFGSKPVNAITRNDIGSWHTRQRQTPGTANIALRLLKAIFNKAVELEVIPGPSPAANVKPYPERPRERFLSPEEFQILFQAIEAEEAQGGLKSVVRIGEAVPGKRGGKGRFEAQSRGITPHAATLFRLLIFTGARLREIMLARWEWVRPAERVIALPDSKTGARRIPLSQSALEELERLSQLRTVGNPYLIEGREPGQPLVNPEKPWRRVRARAGEMLNQRRAEAGLPPLDENPFDGLRIHDLRHSFASVAIRAGMGLPYIGKALGHTQGRTTERYAHLANEAALLTADTVGARIVEAISLPLAPVETIGKNG